MSEEIPVAPPAPTPDPAADPAAAAASKEKRLSEAQWAEISALYETGHHTAEELAKKYEVSTSAVSKHFRKHGITKGSRAGEIAAKITEAVTAEVAATAVSFEKLRKERIEETKKRHYDIASFIVKTLALEIAKAKKDGLAISSTNANMIALRHASAILKSNREELWAILDVENSVDEAQLPNLNIRAMTEEQEQELQKANEKGENELDLEIDEAALEAPDIVVEGDDEP